MHHISSGILHFQAISLTKISVYGRMWVCPLDIHRFEMLLFKNVQASLDPVSL